ncbi:MAG: glycine cleavage system aminomethyltransferase GcvT [Gammaproteobacteria bacterium]|nr:glycine cleavage system aminomethyltransferase GcvT [Gammaproteobacteria bacterium]
MGTDTAQRTALFGRHEAAGARLVDFGGWAMPLHYGSQLDEHHAVRRSAGVFDVSHMTVVDIAGSGATECLQRLLANDVGKLTAPGHGLYSCMLNESGGVVDDLIAYRRGETEYRLVVNAATRDKDLAWLRRACEPLDATVTENATSLMLAVQGPGAREIAASLLPDDLRAPAMSLKSFHCCEAGPVFVARTGYTGEDGFELIIDSEAAGLELWDKLLAAGVTPCGLGARDTLRLEAGLALYGQDLDEDHSPLVSGLGWTIAWDPVSRDFCGRAALDAEKRAGPASTFVGLLLEDRGIMRHGQSVETDAGAGLVTSGSFAPTLQRSIALARVPARAGGYCEVDIRGQQRRARIVKPVFVRRGEIRLDFDQDA